LKSYKFKRVGLLLTIKKKIMPILQNPRPSMSILVKNGHNNGGRGGEMRYLG
jgi:hypothetical protein